MREAQLKDPTVLEEMRLLQTARHIGEPALTLPHRPRSKEDCHGWLPIDPELIGKKFSKHIKVAYQQAIQELKKLNTNCDATSSGNK